MLVNVLLLCLLGFVFVEQVRSDLNTLETTICDAESQNHGYLSSSTNRKGTGACGTCGQGLARGVSHPKNSSGCTAGICAFYSVTSSTEIQVTSLSRVLGGLQPRVSDQG